MIHHKGASAWVIGLALFSMFFGAGNLIFSMIVGKHAEHMYLIGTLGFLITAVLLPFAGVVTMVMFNGDYLEFFRILGRPLGFLFALLLLTFWIPLGSGPRCITLAYAAIITYAEGIPLWLFSIIYSALVFSLTYKENRIIGILGKVLTPILLVSLLAVVVTGIYYSTGLSPVNHPPMQVFWFSLMEGYNTQDLIASFFFSSAIISILKHGAQADGEPASSRSYLPLVMKSGLIGISILSTVYLGLLYMGAAYAPLLRETSKESLLAQLSLFLLGPHAAFLPVLSIALACLTTSVALMLVFSNFFKEIVCQDRISHNMSLGLTILVTFFMSLLGFEGISAVLSAAMQVLYPLLILLMVLNPIAYALGWRKRETIA